MIRSLIAGVAVLLLAGAAALWSVGGPDGAQQRIIKRLLQDQRAELFTDGRLHVFTLGTGSPQPGGRRNPVATAVIAGDEFLLIDAGEGASRTIGETETYNLDKRQHVAGLTRRIHALLGEASGRQG